MADYSGYKISGAYSFGPLKHWGPGFELPSGH
jgi:hypothetical protein